MASSLYAVEYDGTEPTGGDSLTTNLNQYYEVSITTIHFPLSFTNCLPVRRHSLDTHLHRSRPPHGPRSRLLLLRPRTPQIRTLSHLAVAHRTGRRRLPMVPLGLLAGIWKWKFLHWKHAGYWIQECACCAISWIQQVTGDPICGLSGHVCCYYVSFYSNSKLKKRVEANK